VERQYRSLTREHDLHRIAEGNLDALRSMGAIYVDCGTDDDLIEEARELHEKLNSLGVKHVYKEFSGSHTCCVMNSTANALEVFSNAMAFEMLVSVEVRGNLDCTELTSQTSILSRNFYRIQNI
jgi:hypothetical protein